MPLPSAKSEYQVALAAAIEGRTNEAQPRLAAVDDKTAPLNIPSPVQGLQTALAQAFSEPEMAQSEIQRGAFAVGIFGAVAFSGLVWTALFFAAKIL